MFSKADCVLIKLADLLIIYIKNENMLYECA